MTLSSLKRVLTLDYYSNSLNLNRVKLVIEDEKIHLHCPLLPSDNGDVLDIPDALNEVVRGLIQ